MATVTKRALINDLSNQTGLRQQDVATLVEAFIDLMAQRLSEGHDVTFRTFGTFEIRVAKAKIGRNPNNPRAEVQIPDRCVVRFKPGRELKNSVAALPPEKVRAQMHGSDGVDGVDGASRPITT
jgi:nucleoid DNA-binding protein